ncbi:DUF6249 domain-containing protein [Undibacterium sp. Di24W]|uniref:DUF6249 domain-containing protein n=1 Tax=Undibacterium sp. Di24W TaxID=3413033 RepID=UPI003BF29565
MRIEFVLPLILCFAPVLAVFVVLFYRHQQTKARYQTLMYLADKGLDLPVPLLAEPRLAFCERRRGITLVSIGLGVMMMFAVLPLEYQEGHKFAELWGLGLLPLITGLGYLLSWWLNRRDAEHA